MSELLRTKLSQLLSLIVFFLTIRDYHYDTIVSSGKQYAHN
ncbi:hypothetical protein [Desulfosporosinus nitroreducens]|nr:hypothetical protein [Desulfosporosinus nitroreducens]